MAKFLLLKDLAKLDFRVMSSLIVTQTKVDLEKKLGESNMTRAPIVDEIALKKT